jgi:hypothetical protein
MSRFTYFIAIILGHGHSRRDGHRAIPARPVRRALQATPCLLKLSGVGFSLLSLARLFAGRQAPAYPLPIKAPSFN